MAILHSVYFYFRDEVSIEQIEQQRNSILKDLSKIETVKQIWAGSPVGVDRDVVDNDYKMSLHAIFDNRDGLDTYQTHQEHIEFLNRFKQNWVKVKVFDTNI